MNRSQRQTVEGWIEKAQNQLETARAHLKGGRYAEAVQAAQACIELSVKAVLAFLEVDYPRGHGWRKDDFRRVAEQIQKRGLLDRLEEYQHLVLVPLPRLLFILNFWAPLHTWAMYGLDEALLAAPRDLFRKGEAALAVEHAEECRQAASYLRYLSEQQLQEVVSQN